MTAKELKDKLDDDLLQNIITMVKDQTIDKHQIVWMIFLELTDKYWDDVTDDEIVIK